MPGIQPETADEWKWKVESAARTMKEYFKVKADTKLRKAAVAYLKKEQSEIGKAISSA